MSALKASKMKAELCERDGYEMERDEGYGLMM